MSATDEELHFINDEGMDHVTYILLMFRCVQNMCRPGLTLTIHGIVSIAFVIYALVVSLINLWAHSGRNGASSDSSNGIELTAASKWYAPVPAVDTEAEAARHIIGEDD